MIIMLSSSNFKYTMEISHDDDSNGDDSTNDNNTDNDSNDNANSINNNKDGITLFNSETL